MNRDTIMPCVVLAVQAGRFLTAEEIAAQKKAAAESGTGAKLEDDDDQQNAEDDGDADLDEHDSKRRRIDTADIGALDSLLKLSGSGEAEGNISSANAMFHHHQQRPDLLHPGYGSTLQLQGRSPLPSPGPLSVSVSTAGSPMHSPASPMTYSAGASNNNNNGNTVTLRAPYAGGRPSHVSPVSPGAVADPSQGGFFGGQTNDDQAAAQVQAQTQSQQQQHAAASQSPPQQLHHVPHPHSHHATHAHPRSARTHSHASQAHPNEAGGLYNPFELPVPVDLTLVSAQGASDGMRGMNDADMDAALLSFSV